MSELVWRKSSFSGGGNGECVEVAAAPDGLALLRESDQPGVVLAVPVAGLRGLVRRIKAAEFDLGRDER
ncbi:DUF397 domain-containing protein [Streptomyces varsoviensis]|uniref:DUF397 domain-containing protein n=1 Tax=Streptomyces varsoviensis TaxID=67373 RepID=A0ABR5J760_9ACTN|nr:DUF397 domain-containing protein [Streptomyces varsoviensis]KOG89184.1 hypothetical protein ADK38_15680 [Streptomyces varsoviensis]